MGPLQRRTTTVVFAVFVSLASLVSAAILQTPFCTCAGRSGRRYRTTARIPWTFNGVKMRSTKPSSPCRGFADLREAVLLQEWRDDDAVERVAAVDKAARRETSLRFERLHTALQQGDPACRIARNMIADMPAPVRGNGIQGWTLRARAPTSLSCSSGTTPAFRRPLELWIDQCRSCGGSSGIERADEVGEWPSAGPHRGARRAAHRPGSNHSAAQLSLDGPARTQVFQAGRAILPVVAEGSPTRTPKSASLVSKQSRGTRPHSSGSWGTPPRRDTMQLNCRLIDPEVARQYAASFCRWRVI